MNTTRTAATFNQRLSAAAWTRHSTTKAMGRRTEFVPSATLLRLLTMAETTEWSHLQRNAHLIRTRCLIAARSRSWQATAAATSSRLHVDATYLELIDACRHGGVTLHRRDRTTVLTARRMRGARDHIFLIVADRA